MQELSKEELNVRRPVDKEPKWYVLHTRPGYENVAKENLITAIEKYNLQDRVFDIVIPMEDVVEEKKNGKRGYGVIADEVEKNYPSLIEIGEDGYKSVNYIEALTIKISQLEEKIKSLEEEINKLKK